MKVVFFGTPTFAVPTLEGLLQHPEFDVLAVVTQPDKRRGRGNELSPSPVKTVALQHNLPIWQPQRLKKDDETLAALRTYDADCFVVVAYGQILSQEILDMPRYGCVNGHGSLLPKYRGAAPIQWCLYHGETVTGMTTMLMDIGMDTGAMLLKSHHDIDQFETAQDLAIVLSRQCADLMLQTLPQLAADAITPEPQPEADATYAPLIQKSDYQIDWKKPALAIHNQVRGFYPNCVTTFRDKPLKVLATEPLGAAVDQPGQPGQPGAILAIIKQIGVIVQTGQGTILLKEVQPSGKKPQSGSDFANGMRVALKEHLAWYWVLWRCLRGGASVGN
jgi:methionyl-tRNA formyltransferase